MPRIALFVALVMVIAACGDGSTTTSAGVRPSDTTPDQTTAAPVTTTGTAPAETTPPETAGGTVPTSTVPPETTTGGAGVPAITEVVFGDDGYVAITNVGDGPLDLEGHWLCQRPAYIELPSQILQAGETAWVTAGSGDGVDPSADVVAVIPGDGRIGQFSPGGGEMAVYTSSSFGSASDIIDFVAWSEPRGVPRSGRMSVAVEAGIWMDGDLVEVPDGSDIIERFEPSDPILGRLVGRRLIGVDPGAAVDFIRENHRAVLLTYRGDGEPQLSPVIAAVDEEGRVVVSSRETAYKVRNLRRDPRAALCVFADGFFGPWIQAGGTAVVVSLPDAMEPLVAYYRSVAGDHPDWAEYRTAMEAERRVLIRLDVDRAGPERSG